MTFLGPAPDSDGARRLYDEDVEGEGYVMDLSRVWAHAAELQDGLAAVLGRAAEVGDLTFRQRAVLVAATASARGDSYCGLAWGTRLAGEVGAEVAAAVLAGDDAGLDPVDAALARWARRVATDPVGTTAADVTVFVALREAFSTVNAALGARPDAELVERAPAEVVRAVTYGRPPAQT
jgi:hypothetical protein